jgi:hypothetical protein
VSELDTVLLILDERIANVHRWREMRRGSSDFVDGYYFALTELRGSLEEKVVSR